MTITTLIKIQSLEDFKSFKEAIAQDKEIYAHIDFYIDIPEDISYLTVHGVVEFKNKVYNANYIPHDIRSALIFDNGVSFEKLNHKIFAHTILVKGDGLTTTKGLKFVNLHEYSDFCPELSGQKIKLFLSDDFKDDVIEFLPQKTMEKMKSFEGTENSSRIFLGTQTSFMKFSKYLSESVMKEYIRNCKENNIEYFLDDIINYAYYYAYNHIGETVLDEI